MKVAKLPAGSALGSPTADGWKGVAAETVSLNPVPVDAQPNAYIQEAWRDRAYGRTASAQVAAATDGNRLYVRLQWSDDPRGHGEFRDAVGAMFPLNGGGALATFGSADSPLAVWFWEDGRPAGLNLVARGPGVFRREESGSLEATGALSDGSWAVVFSGPAAAAAKGRLGVAVWNGSNDERAGLAAVSREWLTLETD